MTDKRAYFKVDVGYLSNPKVAALAEEQPRAVLLHLQCVAYAAQHFTDGRVPVRLAMRLACAEQCDLDACINAGLLHRVNDATVDVHDFLEHQRSATEARGASDKGKKAADARWNRPPSNASSIPPSNASSMPNPMPREKERDIKEPAPLVPDGFGTWWAHYPKRVNRGAALKAYKTALRKADTETLLAAVQAYAVTAKLADPKFIPHASTWLNGERWLDAEPDPERPGNLPEWA